MIEILSTDVLVLGAGAAGIRAAVAACQEDAGVVMVAAACKVRDGIPSRQF